MALNANQIAQLWVNQGGAPKYANLMAKIALRESGGNPSATHVNTNGTIDRGLFQINSIWGGLSQKALGDPAAATKAAIHILKVQGPKAWATYNAATDAKYLGAFKGAPSSPGTTTTTSTTSLTPQADQGRRAALASFVLSSGKPDPVALAQQVAGFNAQTQTTKNTVTTPGTAASTSVPAPSGKRSPLYEMFWQGQGGIDVKNGQKVAQGFVSGHQDHVHLAAGRSTVVELGRVAQQKFGLHVGENSHFGGVHPVHVQGSYHYKNQAIDVSGDPGKMRAFAHYVANLYGIK